MLAGTLGVSAGGTTACWGGGDSASAMAGDGPSGRRGFAGQATGKRARRGNDPRVGRDGLGVRRRFAARCYAGSRTVLHSAALRSRHPGKGRWFRRVNLHPLSRNPGAKRMGVRDPANMPSRSDTAYPEPHTRNRPMTLLVRPSADADNPFIAAIYAHAVIHSTASFELEPLGEAEMARRRDALLAGGYPYLVAEIGGAVAGYAYAGPYRTRPAYRATVEDSIYVA